MAFGSVPVQCRTVGVVVVAGGGAGARVTLNDENTDFRWVPAREAVDLLPFHGHRIARGGVIHDFIERPVDEWRRIRQHRP